MKQSTTRAPKLGFAVRAIISIALLIAVAHYIGSAEIFAQMKLIHWPVSVAVVMLLASHVLFVTPRWSNILTALRYPIKSASLIGSVFLGFLFNQVLPTAVGGDVLRAWRAHQLGVPIVIAIHSIILDRMSGIVAVLLGITVLLPFADPLAARSGLLWSVGTLAGGGFIAFICLWGLGRLPSFTIPVVGALQRALVGLNTSTFVLLTNLRASIVVLVLAGIGQLIPVFAIGLLANELGAQIPPLDITIITFGAMLAAAVPVSVAGWGIREGALVYLFGMYGVPPQTAFAISILFGVSLIVASTPGVLVLLAGHPAPPDDIEAS